MISSMPRMENEGSKCEPQTPAPDSSTLWTPDVAKESSHVPQFLHTEKNNYTPGC